MTGRGSPWKSVFADGSGPTFSIIIPLEFHRGQAAKCVQAWVHGQSYRRDRFEVIVVAPSHYPVEELETLRGILTDDDQLLLRDQMHDMPLVVEGAAVAKGDALFFTESHCWPEAQVLEKCAEALREHPEWAGFSCRSVRKTHNRLSVLEANMYEADIKHGMKHHPWRKILDQCFVARREQYFKTGGFDASLGHFAEWLLAAKYHQMGMRIGYYPKARVRHFYIGKVEEWEEFTDDFVKGEIHYLAREKSDDACADLLEPVPEWIKRDDWDSEMARGVVAAIWQDRLHRKNDAEASSAMRIQHMRLLAQWLPAAITGVRGEKLASSTQCVLKRLRLVWQTRFSEPDVLKGAMQGYMRSLLHARRLKYLEAVNLPGTTAPDLGEWTPGKPTLLKRAGFHLPEICGGQSCCWSQPAAAIQIPVAEGTYEVTVQWLPVRPEDQPPEPLFYSEGRLVQAHRAGAFGVRLRLEAKAGKNGSGDIRLAWVCRPLGVMGDGRQLGLFIRRVAWRRLVNAQEEAKNQRPLFMLHIRKTAGVSVRDLISNRFSPERCFFQAHSRLNSGTDPSGFCFVTGHMDFGYISQFARRPVVFTVLRDPLDRALSALYFFRGNGELHMRRLEAELSPAEFAERKRIAELANHTSPLEFLRSEPEMAQRQLGNIMVRAFLKETRDGSLGPADLAEALTNLAACDVIGLFERLPETASLLENFMGWEGLGPVPHHNPTQHRQRVSQEDPRILEILAGWNELDSQFYARGVALFEERLRTRRKVETTLRLPPAWQFTFDQPVHGYGWHIREKAGDRWICWMGADDEAWIDLAMDGPADSLLSCRVSHYVSNEVLNGLSMRVNGRPVELKKRTDERGLVLEAVVEAWALFAHMDKVRITFCLPIRKRPEAQESVTSERRTLAVALESISLRPL